MTTKNGWEMLFTIYAVETLKGQVSECAVLRSRKRK